MGPLYLPQDTRLQYAQELGLKKDPGYIWAGISKVLCFCVPRCCRRRRDSKDPPGLARVPTFRKERDLATGSKRKSQPLDQSWARSLGWSIEDGLGGACGAGSAAFECVAVGGGVCGLSLGDGLERSLSDPELAAAASSL